MRPGPRSLLALALAGLVGSAAAAEVGTWDAKGNYTPPARARNFQRLHQGREALPRYPILLVHGIVGWSRARVGPVYMDYFNGIKGDLASLGVPVAATKQTSFASIHERATQVKEQLEAFLAATGAEKVNLVAHSMGGIDCRYLISRLGMADKVASLTSVSSPHQGAWFADFFMKWVWDKQKVGKIWKRLGVPYQAIPEMTVEYVQKDFNPKTPDAPGVRYFSFSGKQPAYQIVPPLSTMKIVTTLMEKAATGRGWNLKDRVQARFLLPKRLREAVGAGQAPQLMDASWVKPELAGKNDGIIPTSSAIWGEHQVTLDADHFEQIGWMGTFRAKRLYRGICRMLADAGL